MTQHRTREDIEWYPEEVFVGRFARDGLGLSTDADDLDPDSLTEPCMSYTRDDLVAALRAENERLREALNPFAEAAGFFDADGNDFQRDYEDDYTLGDPDEEDVRNSLTVGDLRRALAAISSTQTTWQTDRDRMNWLESKEKCSVERDVRGTVKVTAIASRRGVWSEGDTIRTAIDAAMDREGWGDE